MQLHCKRYCSNNVLHIILSIYLLFSHTHTYLIGSTSYIPPGTIMNKYTTTTTEMLRSITDLFRIDAIVTDFSNTNITVYTKFGSYYYYYYYYSHIFPECYYYDSHVFPSFRAQHCNYATLLAGRCGNNLRYSIIFPMGPSFLPMLVFVVRVIVYLCKLCVYFSRFYFATFPVCPCPALFLDVAACIGWKYPPRIMGPALQLHYFTGW